MQTYIVYTGYMKDEVSALVHYKNMLHQASDSNQEPKALLHHYKPSFGGFVAKLTKAEAERMEGLDGVVAVFPNKKRHLLTTKSWDFIGFPMNVKRESYESDVIIGIIDSGIWPGSESFNDKGFGPPPKKWKGVCQIYNFTCNNKLIGARYYGVLNDNAMLSPIDVYGHGTHVASTAAGNPIEHASVFGLGEGTSRGVVPSACIAIYKVCGTSTCYSTSILDAFHDAVADGVDIISVSIGGETEIQFMIFNDELSLGSFHAMSHGILTVFAGGNDGPKPASLSNFSPWSIIVGAGTLNRKFVTKVKLGNNKVYEGISVNTFDLLGKMYPIVYSGDVPNKEAHLNGDESRFCTSNSLDTKLAKGKIVLCEGGSKGALEALRVGAIGVLTQGESFRDVADSYPLAASYLHSKDASRIHKYINSVRTPIATIFKSDELENTLAPVVASFSSRGPNLVTPDILKPDLIAPGVYIMASWSPISLEGRNSGFNIVSGTSMACPHVSGAAGYIKSFHPTWSPAAIRSTLMTTAKQLSPINNQDAEFAYGAGQIDPLKALNPGLIYDAGKMDYVRFICQLGYNKSVIKQLTENSRSCSNISYISARDLNYPSFDLKASNPHNIRGTFERTVTNIGSPTSTYRAFLSVPNGLIISVKPDVLSFTSIGERQTYILTIDGSIKEPISSASLIWDDGEHQVRSPIVVYDQRAEKVRNAPYFNVRAVVIIVVVFVIILIFIFILVKCRHLCLAALYQFYLSRRASPQRSQGVELQPINVVNPQLTM
ncbi:cucumisin-like [Vicia villosa]|uniref:cucumisin-like n=1 Tax=Vicia villosa TaxID=3911 RepID=UPI00273B4D19|nr:cucumisin-like [Vicia villosa]